MTSSGLPSTNKINSDPHQELSQAHCLTTGLAHRLCESLTQAAPIDPANIRKCAIVVGYALQITEKAERACGCCLGVDRIFTKPYAEMLEHHRLAYRDFERLCNDLEKNLSPLGDNIARLAGEIEHHIKAAETAHQAGIQGSDMKKAQGETVF